MKEQQIVQHLFRTESRKITAVLGKLMGMDHLETAEDIAAETFLAALESWPYKGIPPNPVAWLYAVAKNKAKNRINRHHIFSSRVTPAVTSTLPDSYELEIDLSDQNISDSQLQMLFAICYPGIAAEAQVALALRILCGFGIDEIASAFLSNKETINKRLFRAKEKIRAEEVKIEMPTAAEITQRIDTVLTTLYLLFNEGYYSETQDTILRQDFCLEAMRLTYMLIENELTNQPDVNALFALMCFHASRLDARQNEQGEIILYADQDESLWDQSLIARGAYHLFEASQGNAISRYHLEAGIAYWHTIKDDTPEKWENILHLFNQLLYTEYSPIAALNRTYALAKVKGNEIAITEAEKLGLNNNHFYFTLLGELYKELDPVKSLSNFQQALLLAKSSGDKLIIQRKIAELG